MSFVLWLAKPLEALEFPSSFCPGLSSLLSVLPGRNRPPGGLWAKRSRPWVSSLVSFMMRGRDPLSVHAYVVILNKLYISFLGCLKLLNLEPTHAESLRASCSVRLGSTQTISTISDVLNKEARLRVKSRHVGRPYNIHVHESGAHSFCFIFFRASSNAF